MCGGLVFAFFPHADNNKNYYCYNVRQHLKDFLVGNAEVLNVVVDNEKSAEQNRT